MRCGWSGKLRNLFVQKAEGPEKGLKGLNLNVISIVIVCLIATVSASSKRFFRRIKKTPRFDQTLIFSKTLCFLTKLTVGGRAGGWAGGRAGGHHPTKPARQGVG